ncbi:unnamed protein product [Thlaspi arvense]|uniref:Disease resistance R13L4/SHOC-2-like LRR domain-containing protein n=1 Tax=Thlaspi arvense TaxID=13288 RepID=A0AAU9SAI9_THLAR|nr:unnamed protein product [Thlaspi arvense]
MSESRLRLHFHFLSLLLLCCVSPSSFAVIKDLVACLPSQIQALTQFKSEFDSHSCNQTDYLNGVWCDYTTGEVTKLQLPSGCLTGVLRHNSSLFELHHLRYLDLSHNNFISSSLPSEFGNLNKLEVLFLSSNGFLGQVPSAFRNLTLLTKLDLSHNDLTGGFPLVQNLTKLKTLSLGDNHFDGQILQPISKLITLKYLYLSFLNISFPIDLRLFSSLKLLLRLDVSGNSISQASLSSHSDIPLNLEFLALSGCDIREFPNIFKILRNIKGIDLSQNRIKGKVPEWLGNLPRLSIMYSQTVFKGNFLFHHSRSTTC